MPHPKVTRAAGEARGTVTYPFSESVEISIGGQWYPLGGSSAEILRLRDAGFTRFDMTSNGKRYHFDLDKMSRVEGEDEKGAMKSLRYSLVEMSDFQGKGLENLQNLRQAFDRLVLRCDVLSQRFRMEPTITEEALHHHWPGVVEDDELLRVTVEEVFQAMALTNFQRVNQAEWIHYWLLRLESHASLSMLRDLNGRLQLLLQYDAKALERLQSLFELHAERIPLQQLSMSSQSLIQACQSLVASPKRLLEQELAKELLQRHQAGQSSLEDDDRILYHDFLNLMLGRRRHKVYLWMYDISNGKASSWSWLLGTQFSAFWHTGVVVEFMEGCLEFWYGGRLYMSKPGSTPFGEPMEKKFIGYSYKSKEELMSFIGLALGQEFMPANYDSVSHNCNHFSDRLLLYLLNERLPDYILHQPEMILNSTVLLQLLRPFLNRWLGNVSDMTSTSLDESDNHQSQDSVPLGPLMLVLFSGDSGLEEVGRIEDVQEEYCVLRSLDFWHQRAVERKVPKARVRQLLQPSQRARLLLRRAADASRMVTHGLSVYRHASLPVLLTSATTGGEEDPLRVAKY